MNLRSTDNAPRQRPLAVASWTESEGKLQSYDDGFAHLLHFLPGHLDHSLFVSQVDADHVFRQSAKHRRYPRLRLVCRDGAIATVLIHSVGACVAGEALRVWVIFPVGSPPSPKSDVWPWVQWVQFVTLDLLHAKRHLQRVAPHRAGDLKLLQVSSNSPAWILNSRYLY